MTTTDAAPTRMLTTAEVAALVAAAARAIEAEILALPDEILRGHPAPGEWCAKEAVGHLIESERRGFAGRIRTMLETGDPSLGPWDQKAVLGARNDCQRSAQQLATELAEMRVESASLILSLTPEQLARSGQHRRVGVLTVNDLLHEWVHHDRNHLKQILMNVQDYVYPSMGNAQQFTA
jgi:hypothetical protein